MKRITILILSVLAISACNKRSFSAKANETTSNIITTMKKDSVPASDFAKIDSLISIHQIESAEKLLLDLKVKYESSGQMDGYIRAVMSLCQIKGSSGSVNGSNDQTGQNLSAVIDFLQSELKGKPEPVHSVLSNLLAGTLVSVQGYLHHRDQDATSVEGAWDKDYLTWSMEQLQQEINRLFISSIAQDTLKQIPIKNLSLITESSSDMAGVLTVFDFLAFRVLDYMQNSTNFVTEPVYKFQISGSEFFAPADKFIHTDFATRDSLSMIYQSVLVYQRLLDYYQSLKEDTVLFARTNFNRLAFIYEHSVDPEKVAQYEHSLTEFIQNNPSSPLLAIYEWQLINLKYKNDAYSLTEPGSGDKDLLKNLYQDAKNIIRKYKDSDIPGVQNAKEFILTLQSPSLSVDIEKVLMPNQPNLMLVHYSNKDLGSVRLFSMDRNRFMDYQLNRGNLDIKDLKLVKTLDFPLNDPGDYREHTAEVMIEALPPGYYLLDRGVYSKSTYNPYSLFQVSNIGVVAMQYSNGLSYRVVDRKSGEALPGSKVEEFYYSYNRGAQVDKTETRIADKDGLVHLNGQKGRGFRTVIYHGKDELVNEDNVYIDDYRFRSNPHMEYQVFLDRAIYRPGQMVYFKSIAYDRNKDGIPSIVPGARFEITLLDANYQELASQTLIANDFGSIHGSFAIPAGGLTGLFNLRINGGYSKSFRVEEYKRPKFEVVFDTLSESYKLGDQVVISGHAKNYAGVALSGATVTGTITRKQIRRWYGWYSAYYMPDNRGDNSMVISNFSSQTDENGKFEVRFPALPDLSVSPKSNPQFQFDIHTDVTDINGETQSGDKRLTISHSKYNVAYKIANPADVSDLHNFSIEASGVEGNPLTVKGFLKIEKLKEPRQYLRPKAYPNPEFVMVEKSDYKRLWPYEAYLNEANPEFWPVETTLFQGQQASGEMDLQNLTKGKLQLGTYRITYQPEGGSAEESKNIYYLRVNSDKKNNLLDPGSNQLLSLVCDQDTYEPGSTAKIQVRTTNPSGKVALIGVKNNVFLFEKWINASRLYSELKKLSQSDLGGVRILAYTYGYSHMDQASLILNVPWTMKDLNIQLISFRDKLQPGQDETWQLKILGDKKESVMAEVLATMYDQSLDVFTKEDYQRIDFPVERSYINISEINRGATSLAVLNRESFNLELNLEPVLLTFKRQLTDQYYRTEYYRYYGRRYAMMESAASSDLMIKEYSPVVARKASGGMDESANDAPDESKPKEDKPVDSAPSLRTNLEETVFFYPDLLTDKEGNVILKFKMKEALTRWKFRVFGHTKDLAQGYLEREVTTSKELMIFPNLPRFFRENDTIVLSAKISSMGKTSGPVRARLELINELTGQTLPSAIYLDDQLKQVNLTAGSSQVVSWKIVSPRLPVEVVDVKMTAETASHQDGELNVLPVLTNRMMVTETMPFQVRSWQTREFSFDAMNRSYSSKTMVPYRYTLEYTANPLWYAIQALPYIMEYPYECTEQLLNRYVANSLATDIINKYPKVKSVFDHWRQNGSIQSNLYKNQELKSALLQETPWVLDAKSETERQKNIALLFDFNKMSNESNAALRKILERQNSDGSFSWFPGCSANEYITSYVLENLGHLSKLGITTSNQSQINEMAAKAIQYCDNQVVRHYEDLIRWQKERKLKPEDDYFDHWVTQYYYARSFFRKGQLPQNEAFNYYYSQVKKHWSKQQLYMMGIAATVLERYGDHDLAATIIEGIKQTAIKSDELGMYWNSGWGWYWYQMPIETQSLMIEAFDEIAKDKPAVEEMKLWLLKNKQTNHWPTTKATASAIYALMLTGGVSSLETIQPEISIGKDNVDLSKVEQQAGTGYLKINYSGDQIQPDMTKIKVTNRSQVVNWGGVYWQYFEDMDKITSFKDTPLNISKTYYKVKKTDRGESLLDISQNPVQVGDRIRVRTVIRVDRPMEYVHLKDMRPAGLEQIENISGYRYNHGLGYYQAPKDLANNFFIDYLRPGTYTFEYDLVASLKGNFSTGISTIQCMYAPEFSSHSAGQRFEIE
jgi:uncharacterized protein YfaS (alpha-2-macroglobulin family)